jgi:hypothetical protein
MIPRTRWPVKIFTIYKVVLFLDSLNRKLAPGSRMTCNNPGQDFSTIFRQVSSMNCERYYPRMSV